MFFFSTYISVLKFLIDQYKVDPHNFIYDHKYDVQDKTSIMSNVYVDLNDILSTPISDKRKLQTLYTAITRATHQVIFF